MLKEALERSEPDVRAQLRPNVRDHAAAGPAGISLVDRLLDDATWVQVEAVDADQARGNAQALSAAAAALIRPVNLGDTYSYASRHREPLYFSNVASHTDISPRAPESRLRDTSVICIADALNEVCFLRIYLTFMIRHR